MSHVRRALALVIAVAVALLALPAAAPAVTGGPVDLVAVAGTDHQLWVRWSDEAGWRPLGGQLVDTPVVLSSPALFVGLGADGNVWARSWTRDWQPLGVPGTSCRGPGARVSAGWLSVACVGADGAVWHADALVPGDGSLPTLSGWRSLGGRFLYGAAEVEDNAGPSGTPQFAYTGIGVDHYPYTRYVSPSSPGAWHRRAPVNGTCGGPASTQDGGFACRDGGSEQLRVADQAGEAVLQGRTTGRPAVVLEGWPTRRYLALGADGQVWQAERSNGTASAFAPVGGAALYGVSAVHYEMKPAG